VVAVGYKVYKWYFSSNKESIEKKNSNDNVNSDLPNETFSQVSDPSTESKLLTEKIVKKEDCNNINSDNSTPINKDMANEGDNSTPINNEVANEGDNSTPINKDMPNEGDNSTSINSDMPNEGDNNISDVLNPKMDYIYTYKPEIMEAYKGLVDTYIQFVDYYFYSALLLILLLVLLLFIFYLLYSIRIKNTP